VGNFSFHFPLCLCSTFYDLFNFQWFIGGIFLWFFDIRTGSFLHMIICLAFSFVLRNFLFRLHIVFRLCLLFRMVYDSSLISFSFYFNEFLARFLFSFWFLPLFFFLWFDWFSVVCFRDFSLVFSGPDKLFSSDDYLFGFLFVSYMRVFVVLAFLKHSDHVFSSK